MDNSLFRLPKKQKLYIQDNILPYLQKYFARLITHTLVNHKIQINSTDGSCKYFRINSNQKIEGDLNVIVGVNPFVEMGQTSVAGVICKTVDGRPVIAEMLLNKDIVYSQKSVPENLINFVHEMIHLLGFSFNYYSQLFDPVLVKYLIIQFKHNTDTKRGKKVKQIKSPQLSQIAKQYFGCNTLEGLETTDSDLEYSHWSERMVPEEIMTKSPSINAGISNFTLSLLSHSNWYRFNYSLAHRIVEGKNQGCQYIDNKCIFYGKEIVKGFGCRPTQPVCTKGGYAYGYCGIENVKVEPNLPVHFNYNGYNHRINHDHENCPYPKSYWNQVCSSSLITGIIFDPTQLQFFRSSDHRCFKSQIYKETVDSQEHRPYLGCYKINCLANDRLEIDVQGIKVICDGQQQVQVNGVQYDGESYKGVLYCPDIQEYCQHYAKYQYQIFNTFDRFPYQFDADPVHVTQISSNLIFEYLLIILAILTTLLQ